ncbi:MAG: ABC transporter substrate-binding protein [Caldilineaceae bacterium]|nr:ABC transporter substrate-binding protein [Caldilineaceae bacterium]
MAGCAAPTASDTGSEASAPTDGETSADSGAATRLIIAQAVDLEGLEPSEVSSRAEANIFAHIYATLYEITDSGVIEPYLAKDYQVSEDGTEYTFTLNEGLTCHDGEPLTAEDVVYTFQRAADPENGFTGNTAGFVLDALGYVDARVDGDLDATIVINAYSPIALGLISEVYIHCKDYYESVSLEDAAYNPVGSGPYKFVEWVKDDYTLLEKWDEFTLRDATYDELEWRVIPEASTRTAELIAGNVDIITNVPPDQHDAVNNSGKAVIVGVAGTRRMYVGFNQRDIFDDTEGGRAIKDPAVRVALQYAVDVPTICQSLLAFDCERASSLVNPPNDNPNLEPYPYDPEMAEKLLDEAGYPRGDDGVRFDVTFQAGRGRYLNDEAVVLAIGQYLTDVGVNTTVEILDWSSEFVPALRQHDLGPLYFVGTGGSTWSAVYDMADLSEPTGATNYTEWQNPEWFSRWAQLSETQDADEQKALIDEMLEIFYNDPPWLLLYFQPDFYGISDGVDWTPRRDEQINVVPAKPIN